MPDIGQRSVGEEMSEQNELGQPISFVVENWEGAQPAEQSVIVGARCRLEPIDADRHAADLYAPSRAAAARLGFRYEGTFRQQTLAKGRNRDTAWYSITDIEWPGLRAGFEAWLDSGNFDDAGRQLQPLSEFMPESAGRALVIDA